MDFSESSFLRAQGLGWDETSAVGGTGTLWSSIYDGVYFAANEWVTIDKGLNRLAEAFHPIVDNRLTYGRRIEALSFDEQKGKTGIHWHEDGQKKSSEYDKTIVAVPFSVARLWRTPTLNPVMSEAISGLGYSFACKVAVSQAFVGRSPTYDVAIVQDPVLGAPRQPYLWRMRNHRHSWSRLILLPCIQYQRYRSWGIARLVRYRSWTFPPGHVGGGPRPYDCRGDGGNSWSNRR